MQNIALKKSTIAAMNQAYQSYREQISKAEERGIVNHGELGGFSDLNSYLLMLFIRQIITQSGEQMSAGEYVITQLKMMNELQKLDVD